MKTFTSAAPATAPLDFEMQWWKLPDDGSPPTEGGTEQFKARRNVPPGLLLDLAGAVVLDADGKRLPNIGAVDGLMQALLYPDDFARWSALLRDPDRWVSMEQIADVILWLSEAFMGRPTGALSG